MKEIVKSALTHLGARCDPGAIHFFQRFVTRLQLGRWMQGNGCWPKSHCEHREQVFDTIGRNVADKIVLYLEFGVFEGEATRYWSRLLRHPQSVLYGFDAFEGLPEAWNGCAKGFFSTEGVVPTFEDPRVRMFKGLFEETLPRLKLPVHDVLVVNMDADLYSSTKFVLKTLRESIKVGSYLYFDEFCDAFHEFRAFAEFVTESGMRFETIAESSGMTCVAFRRIA